MATEREVLENCVCHRTRMAARAVTRLYDDTLRSVGLRATQLAVLAAVGGDEVVSIAGLAKFMGMDRSTLTRNLAPLEREGLIRVGVEGWRRSRTVEITKKGRSRLREALPLWETARRHCSDGWASADGPISGPTWTISSAAHKNLILRGVNGRLAQPGRSDPAGRPYCKPTACWTSRARIAWPP